MNVIHPHICDDCEKRPAYIVTDNDGEQYPECGDHVTIYVGSKRTRWHISHHITHLFPFEDMEYIEIV